MPLDDTLSTSFGAYVEKIRDVYNARGIAVAIVDQNGPIQEL